jgi:hypothetical protein
VTELSVYIAGPLYSSGDLTLNNRAAIDAAHALESAEIPGVRLRPFIPHICTLTWQLVHPRTHETGQAWDDYWLRKCDAWDDYWLRKCDALLRLPGKSVGDHEVLLAYQLEIPVCRSIDSIIGWAKNECCPECFVVGYSGGRGPRYKLHRGRCSLLNAQAL